MKKLLLPIVFAFIAGACKKEAPRVSTTQEVAEIPAVLECYQGILKQDTVTLNVVRKAGQISGTLRFDLSEKDNSDGMISGTVKGDTIFADYTFNAEGTQSVREVAFLKQGNVYLEGYGDVEQREGGMRFKDPANLKFDSNMILTKINCR